MRTFFIFVVISLFSPAVLLADAVQQPECLKGINYTAWSWNAYSTPGSDQSLANAELVGCTWVAITVFWFQDTITSTEIYADSSRYSASTESVRHAIDRCHQLGMKVMLKPMVDVKSGAWRATIVPSQAWFTEYQQFMNFWADEAEARNVEMLCIGCELDGTTSWSASWRSIASNTQTRYSGELVYAVNHGNEQNITWWDAVDYIGIDAYYQLTSKTNPTLAELNAAWNSRANSIEIWLNNNWPTMQVIFTEVGYCSYDGSNMAPWASPGSQPIDLQEQADCYQALLTVCKGRSWWSGVFWWNWETNPSAGGLSDKNFTPQGKPAQQIMSDYYIPTAGNFDDDWDVDFADLYTLASGWLQTGSVADIAPLPNGDDIVNFLDFAIFAQYWGTE